MLSHLPCEGFAVLFMLNCPLVVQLLKTGEKNALPEIVGRPFF